jgi:RNA polymerase sigma factor (TIGR02999 family)
VPGAISGTSPPRRASGQNAQRNRMTPPDPIPDPDPDSAPAPMRADALFREVYDRLKGMASRRLDSAARETLDTTALVHELYLRMCSGEQPTFEHPAQFFGYAARAIRHLLQDRARHRLRQRAGGGWMPITLTGNDERLALESAEETMALDEALTRLEQADPRAARVVELRYFAGLSIERTAEVLGLGRSSAVRDWQFARAFLQSELDGG